MFRNMVTSLFREEQVVTTVPRAKEVRRVAERVITFAKRGDLHARRQAARVVRDTEVLQKLFSDIGPRFAERPGGYTRILKTGFRPGDNAPMSILELVERKVEEAPAAVEAAGAKKAEGRKAKAALSRRAPGEASPEKKKGGGPRTRGGPKAPAPRSPATRAPRRKAGPSSD
jgi:large subunit ribosomal protein L17